MQPKQINEDARVGTGFIISPTAQRWHKFVFELNK